MKKNNKSKFKNVSKIFLKIIITFIIIFFGILLFITIPPGEKLVRNFARDQLQNALAKKVNLAALETNLFNRVQIRNLVIYDNVSPDSEPLLYLRYAHIKYHLLDLLKNQLTLTSVMLDTVSLAVFKDSSGGYNLPQGLTRKKTSSGTTSSESPFQINLEKVSLNNVFLKYSDSTIPLTADLVNFRFLLHNHNSQKYTFHIDADSLGLKAQNKSLAIHQLKSVGRWMDNIVYADTISFGMPGLQYFSKGRIKTNTNSVEFSGDYRLTTDLNQLQPVYRDFLPEMFMPVKGMVNITGTVAGTVDNPELTAKMDFPEIHLAGMSFSDGILEAGWRENSIDLTNLKMSLLGGQISATGKVILDSLLAHRFTFNLNEIELGRIWKTVYHEESLYKGIVNGKIVSTGALNDPDKIGAEAEVKVRHIQFKSKPLPDVESKLSIHRGLAQLEFRQYSSYLTSTVKYSDENIGGHFSLKITNLETFTGLLNIKDLTGKIEANGNLSGTFTSPKINTKFSGISLYYQNFPVNDLSGRIIYENEQTILDDINLSGRITRIDTTKPLFNIPGISGGFSYKGYFDGNLNDLKGEIQTELFEPGYSHIRFNNGKFLMTMAGNQLEVGYLELQHDSLILHLSGEMNLSSYQGHADFIFSDNFTPSQIKGESKTHSQETSGSSRSGEIRTVFNLSDSSRWQINIDGQNLCSRQILNIFPNPQEISGTLNFNLIFAGNLKYPDINLNFSFLTPRFQQVLLDSVHGSVSMNNNRISFSLLELLYKTNRSRASGYIDLNSAENKPFSITGRSVINLNAEGNDIDLKLFKSFLDPQMHIEGMCTYSLEINGQLKQPNIKGLINIHSGYFQLQPELPAIRAIEADLVLRDSTMQINYVDGRFKDTPFSIKGEIAALPQSRFETDIKLFISKLKVFEGSGTLANEDINYELNLKNFDLSYMQPFIPNFTDLQGRVDAQISSTGSLSYPSLKGNLDISNLSFKPENINAPINKGNILVSFNGNTTVLDTLFLDINGGSVTGRGKLSQQKGELTDLNLQFNINKVEIKQPREFIINIKSSKFCYKKQNNYYTLDGDVILGESRFIHNFQPKSLLNFMNAVERPAPAPARIVKQTKLNIRIRESNELWIENNLAKLRLHSELGLVGTLAQSNITGRLEVKEGYVLYLDRKFRVVKGVMDFIDPNHINPIIDLHAEANIKNYQTLVGKPYKISLYLSGPLDQSVFELSSEPPLEKSDIISLLTLGATRDQITGDQSQSSGSSVSDIIKDRLEVLSSQKITGYTARKVGNLLGLEEVSIEGNLFRFGKSWGPQLLASKKISERAELTYSTTVGHMNEQSIRLDYRLSKRFSVQGETDQQGRTGIDLKYRVKFK